MARKAYAKRYAQAVFEIALEKQELERWQSDLSTIASLGEDVALIALLESPKLHFQDKARILSEQLREVNPLALNLVYLLAGRGRLGMLRAIADEYQRRLDSYQGIEQAEVVTAVPLGDEDRQRIAEHLGAAVGKKAIIQSEIDSGLIGGVVIRIGGKLLDGSVRSRLEALKKEISGAVR